MSSSNCCFLICIQISQEASQVPGIPISLRIFHSLCDPHKDFHIVNETEVDVFLEFLLFLWSSAAAAAAKSLQSCPTLCDPTDGSPLGSSVPGILQARVLEWVAISFSNALKWKVKMKLLSRARLLTGTSTGVGCRSLLWWSNGCWQFDLWFLCLF